MCRWELNHGSRAREPFLHEKWNTHNNGNSNKNIGKCEHLIVSTSYNQNAFDTIGLQAPREPYEICTDTEAGTLASRHADGRGDQVENREDRGGNERQRGDLVNRQRLPGDKKRGARNNETLNEVFDRTIDNFSDVHI